jgi:hypothetical protein
MTTLNAVIAQTADPVAAGLETTDTTVQKVSFLQKTKCCKFFS